jgi:hypothetical protein
MEGTDIQSEVDGTRDDGEVSGTEPDTQHDIEKAVSQKPESNLSAIVPNGTLDFSEDDGEALLVLLRITHFKFIEVPATLELETLFDVAILCDQYDCAHLVKPWLRQWLREEHSPWKQPSIGRERWLLVAWVFGRERLLKEVASMLVLEMVTYGNGRCIALEGRLGPMPPGLIGNYWESLGSIVHL